MHEIRDALAGSRIQRIDGPFEGAIALTLHRADRHGCLLLSAEAGRAAWGWLDTRPRGESASAFVQLLRKHLESARIADVSIDDRGLAIAADGIVLRLATSPADVLLEIGGQIAGALRRAHDERASTAPLANDLASLENEGPRIVERRREQRTAALVRAIARRRAKLERRLEAIEGDLSRAGESAILRHRASLLLAHLHAIPKGAREARVTDYAEDPPAELTIAIDPKLGPKGQAEALFRRAKKLDRTVPIASTRLEQARAEISRLDDLRARAIAEDADLASIDREAASLGLAPQIVKGPRSTEARKPYRTFRGEGDRAILVGRSSADNDTLTLRVARPYDHWLHVRGASGSHVVVPLDRTEACPPGLLADAAHLAAHFSSMRSESPVEIVHVARRYVRKPRGAPPGAVVLTREKVMLLRVEADRLERLLAAEDHA